MGDEKKESKKKKYSVLAQQEQLRKLVKDQPERPPVDMSKLLVRAGALVVVAWLIAVGVSSWQHTMWPIYGAIALTVVLAGIGIWLYRLVKKNEALGAILKGADTKEGREAALRKLESEFKKDDAQAALAKAQLEMHEDPRKALATLESVDLKKQYNPGVADQVRAMRAMIHLTLGELPEARALADELDLGKQQEPKTRAMFATVAAEAWARTGLGKKAVETLELFNPEDPEIGEMRIQMWRARAFAYAAVGDWKGAERVLKKLADTNAQLLAMFVGVKKVHPMLERSAKQILMRSGAVRRQVVRQKA
jgi:tetratricopeptide (TPR) repeat protein